MLAKEILKQVRYNLSDMEADRWEDGRLLTLLNNGIKDIAKNTTLFVETLFYTVVDQVVDIDLSTQALKILRAEYNDLPLSFYSFDEMDKKDKEWQLETGTEVKALVYDKQKNSLLKQYPIVTNAINDNIVYSSPYGIVTHISYSDILPELAETEGDVGAIPDDALIKFYYIRKHAKVIDINTELDIDELIEQPLISYITGHALRDNQDAQNRDMAKEELGMYYQLVEEYNIQKSQLFVRADLEAGYRPYD